MADAGRRGRCCNGFCEINREIRAEAFAGMPPAARGAFIDTLEQAKENLAVEEEVGVEAVG